MVGSINGKYSTIDWSPIYFKKKVSWKEYCAICSIADLCFLAPFRDGMNLTSMEFIACQEKKQSPLLLSEYAGAAQCLSGAFLINPYNQKQVADAIHQCLSMPEREKQTRFRNNWDYVQKYTSIVWIESLINALINASNNPNEKVEEIAPEINFPEVEAKWTSVTIILKI